MTEASSPDIAAPARPKPSLRAIKSLMPYAVRYKGRMAGAFVALTCASGAMLVVPVAIRRMMDFGFSAQRGGLIDTYFLGLLAVVAVLAIASGARYFFVMTLGERIVSDLRADVFAHLCSLHAAFYDTARVGELISRLTADTTQMKSAFGSSASVALRNLFLFVGAVGLMIYSSLKLSGLVLVAIPVIVLPLVASGRAVRGRARRAQDTLADATAYASESLGAVRVMQAYGAERRTRDKFATAVEAAYAAAREAMGARSILTGTVIFLAFGSVIAVLWFGSKDVLAGRMTGGALTQFVIYAVIGASALGQLSEVWTEISAAAGAAGRISDLLAITPAIVAPTAPLAIPQPGQGAVTFEDVSFSYASRADAPALHEVSFTIAPGETVAIVGPSGAGKSTLFQLLLRFYDPDAGRILIDGVDIRTADPAMVRAHIRSVPQDPMIFGASIAENIAYGADEPLDPAAIATAARQAAADRFIQALPEAYETRTGERGVTLSGGQRQRLAIARALYRPAPLLLLAEVASSLDAESEGLVQRALERLMTGRTTLVIAHRLATVLNADRILVLDGGRIVEEGTHTTLIARDGLYARLAKLQFDTQPSLRQTAAE